MKKTVVVFMLMLRCISSLFAQENTRHNPEEMIGEWELIPTGIILDAYRPAFVAFDRLPKDVKEWILEQRYSKITFIDSTFVKLSQEGEQPELVGAYLMEAAEHHSYTIPPYNESFFDAKTFRLSIVAAVDKTLEFIFQQQRNGDIEWFQSVVVFKEGLFRNEPYDITVTGALHNTEGKTADLWALFYLP